MATTDFSQSRHSGRAPLITVLLWKVSKVRTDTGPLVNADAHDWGRPQLAGEPGQIVDQFQHHGFGFGAVARDRQGDAAQGAGTNSPKSSLKDLKL
jgi:hypothetical protein